MGHVLPDGLRGGPLLRSRAPGRDAGLGHGHEPVALGSEGRSAEALLEHRGDRGSQ